MRFQSRPCLTIVRLGEDISNKIFFFRSGDRFRLLILLRNGMLRCAIVAYSGDVLGFVQSGFQGWSFTSW